MPFKITHPAQKQLKTFLEHHPHWGHACEDDIDHLLSPPLQLQWKDGHNSLPPPARVPPASAVYV